MGKLGSTVTGIMTTFLKELKLGGGTTDRRGGVELTITAGKTLDLGEIKVPAASLKAR